MAAIFMIILEKHCANVGYDATLLFLKFMWTYAYPDGFLHLNWAEGVCVCMCVCVCVCVDVCAGVWSPGLSCDATLLFLKYMWIYAYPDGFYTWTELKTWKSTVCMCVFLPVCRSLWYVLLRLECSVGPRKWSKQKYLNLYFYGFSFVPQPCH